MPLFGSPKTPKDPLISIAIIFLAIVAIYYLVQSFSSNTSSPSKDFGSFYREVKEGKIKEVEMTPEEIKGIDKNGLRFQTTIPPNAGFPLAKELEEHGVAVKISRHQPGLLEMFFSSGLFFFILLLLFFVVIMPKMQGGGHLTAKFGKSKAKISQNKTVTFKDVAGVEEAKEELEEIIEFLKTPQKFQKLGAHIPKGVLLVGSPGTGKTLLARAVAGEAHVPFFSITGSDFVEMFVGVGASRVRDLFETGKKNAPCIIFIDEVDAVGRHRGAGLGGGHDEREQTLNQLLAEMDGFESNTGVIIIAASNRPDILDPALLRPGRFDRQVVVPLPDIKGREAILKIHTRNKKLAENVDLVAVARGTAGFSGAALKNLVNEAALRAARFDRQTIALEDMEEARDKELMGKERRSSVISESEKRTTAHHEAGHALVAYCIPGSDPLHKITIIPRGLAMGLTQQLPEEDKHNWSEKYLEGKIAILMGGRCAEKIFLNTCTTGAANDIEVATEYARKMVTIWGMSKVLGPVTLGRKEGQVFLGKEITRPESHSEKTAELIDQEIKRIIQEGCIKAEKILKTYPQKLTALAEALLEKETLDSSAIKALLGPCPVN